MSELRNPFACRNGKIVTIADIDPKDKGRECGCECPNCHGKFIARIGAKNQPHFAHDGEPCDLTKAILVSLYAALSEGLAELVSFVYPDCWARTKGPSVYSLELEKIIKATELCPNELTGAEKIISKGRFEVGHSEVLYNAKGVPKAICLTSSKGEHRLAVAIIPPPSFCKVTHPKAIDDIATLAICLPDGFELERIKIDDLKRTLCLETRYKEWLSSPNIDRWQKKRLEDLRQVLEAHKQKQMDLWDTPRKTPSTIKRKKPTSPKVARSADTLRSILKGIYPAYSSVPTDQIVERDGIRFCFCKTCREWYPESEFLMDSLGDKGREINAGTCKRCNRRLIPR